MTVDDDIAKAVREAFALRGFVTVTDGFNTLAWFTAVGDELKLAKLLKALYGLNPTAKFSASASGPGGFSGKGRLN